MVNNVCNVIKVGHKIINVTNVMKINVIKIVTEDFPLSKLQVLIWIIMELVKNINIIIVDIVVAMTVTTFKVVVSSKVLPTD